MAVPPYPLGIWIGGIGSIESTAFPTPENLSLISFNKWRWQSKSQCSCNRYISTWFSISLNTGPQVKTFLQLKSKMFSLFTLSTSFAIVSNCGGSLEIKKLKKITPVTGYHLAHLCDRKVVALPSFSDHLYCQYSAHYECFEPWEVVSWLRFFVRHHVFVWEWLEYTDVGLCLAASTVQRLGRVFPQCLCLWKFPPWLLNVSLPAV